MLHIDPPLLLITLVIFLGLIFVLNSILYKPLLGFIDDRNKSIKNDEESVSKNASDTGNYEAQIEKIIGDARAEAQAKKHAALSEAKERAATKVAIKKESLEADFDSFMAGLADRKAELKSNLTAKIPELKSTLAGSLSKM
ncbi:MAG: F0F1 ATP synthase subunit B' [Campylobacter sp.]|jgi:F-type H+-transporting ATPase subunit b|uniref:FoF1 ATP synthase subunit B' n=1 Tax=Campylobacter sp. TaxID=205 RepID=UPI001B0EBC03|nr:FoF1 ATP synthase subunit B' [Campylobacter sp.]MBO7155373.1 F0F1 ATP synthase subunit B' [Campylobacter sp.]MBP3674866.1 F0F1 ATP synthase subunit B' [Campylobacter sp.]MBR2149125.1 F0F1 ATP synthase subunit B' [Campylobacter sp.]MBR2159591.1 F0F1 ATP synthase subunit B' [Campylobacter sp.]MBR2164816.1 F0F1 ATP synthase subunit B' [Campylobacter sp.]